MSKIAAGHGGDDHDRASSFMADTLDKVGDKVFSRLARQLVSTAEQLLRVTPPWLQLPPQWLQYHDLHLVAARAVRSSMLAANADLLTQAALSLYSFATCTAGAAELSVQKSPGAYVKLQPP